MVVEIASRLLAVIAAVAFTAVLTGGQLPLMPKGRWTFAVLFGLGLTMCTFAGVRDGVTGPALAGSWPSAVLAGIGASAFVLLVAVLIGFSWRLGVAMLAVQVSTSWLLVLGQAFYVRSDGAIVGALRMVPFPPVA